MESAEDEMARLGGLDRHCDRLQVAGLPDEDDVGVLPQRGAQGLLEAGSVDVHLPLVHEALLVWVYELDRVLDRDDVVMTTGADQVDGALL